MRRIPYILIFLSLLAGTAGTAAAAAAAGPFSVVMASSSPCIVADGQDSTVITVTVTDTAGNAIGGADVSLDVSQPWGIAGKSGKTDGTGAFVAQFLPTFRSGNAMVTARVSMKGSGTAPVVQTCSQAITADLPARDRAYYQGAATIGALTRISVRVYDRWGNPVDSRKKANMVGFTAMASGSGGFLDDRKETAKEISVALDDTGTASADFILDTKPGSNFVAIDPPEPLQESLISIEGISDDRPAALSVTVSPDGTPPTVSTDGESRFILRYDLTDRYGNPSTYHNLSITTNAGEKQVVASNNEGKATITYGPKNSAGDYVITATAVENPAVTAAATVRFASDDPSNMLLTATPQSMASLEVNGEAVSSVMAKVIDKLGNPVPGQPVSFSLTGTSTGTFVQTSPPAIESGSTKTSAMGTELTVVSDENGYAMVNFYPGAFTTDTTNPGYSALAQGTAKVRARWAGVTRDIDLGYRNYPYLSVSTSVDPMTVETNREIELSVLLRGDGYALIPRPVDVFMVTDRSGSMVSDYPDRMVSEMNAGKLFASQFDYASDRLGQISFGAKGVSVATSSSDCGKDGDKSDDASYAKANYPGSGRTYTDYANLDLPLGSGQSQITAAVSGLVPGGYTPMRYAIYRAVKEIKASGRAGAVRALVVMSDGDYNYYGDPLARGSPGSSDPTTYTTDLSRSYVPFPDLASQNIADFAKSNNIRIYTIGYAGQISSGGRDTLESLAQATGGKYYYALTGDDLTAVYTQIAGDLKDTAGVDTTMDLDFKTIEVNGAPTAGTDVSSYVYRAGKSTFIVPPAPGLPWTENSQAAWDRDQKLSFDLGTVKVNQEWQVSLVLKILKSGNIRILGPTSKVIFDGGKSSLTIPDTYVTAVPEGLEKGLQGLALQIRNLRRTDPGTSGKPAELAWDISYNGFDPDITQEIQVAPGNSGAFSYRGTTLSAARDTSGHYTLDLSTLQPGIYQVRVIGFVDDADSSWAVTDLIVPEPEQKPMIVIR